MAIIKPTKQNPVVNWINAMPARLIVLSFAFVILTGALLLTLPIASESGKSLGFLRALFTSTSAVCVTGLVTNDTATSWTTFGEMVIICLIQIGGLGLVTILSYFYSLMRRKATFKTLVIAAESTASSGFADVFSFIRKIIMITFTIELTGGVLLSSRYIQYFGWQKGIYKGMWQAVSAFCNAGFDLIGDTKFGPYSSLVAFNGDPVVILTTGMLIVCGGLGFLVWTDILSFPKKRKLDYHSKLVIIVTATLVFGGMLFFLITEYNNVRSTFSMGSLPEWQRPLAAWFQSVTPRTAGFNSLDQNTLTDSSKLFSTILMYIGAAPASTGGGIKITTFTVILFTIISDIRGRDNTIMMKHRISRETFTRALAIAGLGMTIMLTATMVMTYFEQASLVAGKFSTLDLLFESASAFGTVGLTAAGTPGLTEQSWMVLIPAMFLGRVGPASFAISLAMRKPTKTERVYPEGKTLVG